MTKPKEHRLSIRIDLASGGRIGPGKIALLEEIERSGSISAAGREMKMSYRRAWRLVEDLNHDIGAVVEAAAGGVGGGGARLTEAGRTLVQQYRALEQAASTTAHPHLDVLTEIIGPRRRK
jgi:molybdate transport system regulatory protein